jgi:fumarate hydratase subunit alpha
MKGQIIDLIRETVTSIPEDVQRALQEAYENETDGTARLQLKTILNNVKIASEKGIPVCQDTGVPIFYVKLGRNAKLPNNFEQVLREAVEEATEKVPLRPNVVSPLNRKNTKTNTGEGFPIIKYDIVNGKGVEITFLPKGGGSENCSALCMLKPSDGLEGVKKFILGKVKEFGGKPCPPYILGIGIGGTAEGCMELSKKALLRRIGSQNQVPGLAKLESELKDAINAMKIGPMGMGGGTTALAVHVEAMGEHTTMNCVGVSTLCWAARRGTVEWR